MIDWTKPESQITEHFTVKDALWLPQLKRLANEEDGLNDKIKANLVDLFSRMEKVRDILGCPVAVICAYRPPVYNALVGGAPRSAHMEGRAVDWSPHGMCCCDRARELLLPKLAEIGLRVENLPKSVWVHCDTRIPPPGGAYFFIP